LVVRKAITAPEKNHDRSLKDLQQKQLLLVRHAITAEDSRQKPQEFAGKALSLVVRHAITTED